MKIIETYNIYRNTNFRDIDIKKAFERSITTDGVIKLIEENARLKQSANVLWDSVTGILSQNDIDRLERIHRNEIKILGIL